MAEYLEIIPIIDGQEGKFRFTSSTSCNQLGVMLLDWDSHCFTDFVDKITQEDKAILKSTYGKESLAVQEGDEKFEPNIVKTDDLITVFVKVKTHVLYPILKDSMAKGHDKVLLNILRDFIVISECIGVLKYIQNTSSEVYLAVEGS